MPSLEPVASPPPPYSPRRHERDGNRTDSPRNLQGTVSPSDTVSPATDPSRYGTPVSAATTISPDLPLNYGSHRSPPPTGTPRAANSNARASTTSDFPPPPPTSSMTGSRVRSSSKSHAERLLSTLGSRAMSSSASQPTSAIDTLQAITAQALAQAPEIDAELLAKPPASRRAASTGGIGVSGHSSRTTSRSPGQTRWEPGMPLPPPPPGPPPATARSQSLNRSSGSLPVEHLSVTAPRARRPPGNGTALAPVPPTPSDWREGLPNPPDASQPAVPSRLLVAAPLHIDTGVAVRSDPSEDELLYTAVSANPYSAHVRQDPSCASLARSPAVRNRSAKGIRERRSESRSGKGRATETSADIQSSTVTVSPESLESLRPTDLVLPVGSGSFSGRRTASRITPTSGKSRLSLDETLRSPPFHDTSGQARSLYSSNTTPQAETDRSGNPLRHITPTPPFSPSKVAFGPDCRTQASPALAPRSLPTPPPQQLMGSQSSSFLDVSLATDERPISHLLHIPNSDGSIQEPLQPAAQRNRTSMTDLLGPESPKAFAQRAIERHRNFAEREANASSDSERLEIFVRFMIAESRIRREQYATVFEEEAVSITELTQGLFKRQSQVHSPREIRHAAKTEGIANVAHDRGASSMSDSANESNRHRSSSLASRTHESPMSISTDCGSQNRPDSSWWNDYIPSLSPIASMSAVTGQDRDEMGSRGRASSRWWEDKSGGSASGDGFSVLKKSKRESKYMGLPKEARDLPALVETTVSRTNNGLLGYGECSGHSKTYGANEYPPEKVGWHQQSSPLPPPPPHPPTPLSAPFTPDPKRLDISRLVTLPPPYPRHHPAVNNNHPDLADIRAVVRSLHETEDVDAIRASYDMQMTEKRKRADSWRQHQRSLHDQDMRFRMDHEDLFQHQFDQAQSELDAKVQRSEKEITQTDFDLFQNLVVSPSHALFAERITKANLTIENLSGKLFSDAQKHSPNLPQEEGDEQPELLEKLTQLKWLFEGRESLHRKTYDLLTERNEKYRAIVLLPYQQSNKPSKSLEAETFFANDAHDRLLTFQKESLTRYDTFLGVIEANVTRGVEIQLSAFWDIAPPLHRVLSRVPQRLEGFEIQIPANEFAENPNYYKWPLQYLYSLLGHAQKSAYQFIESQINLLCLLHEVRNAAATARYLTQEQQGSCADDERRREEAGLTADLKEKVGVVEGQWEEALGEELMSVRERVRCWLLENGGWDDEDDEHYPAAYSRRRLDNKFINVCKVRHALLRARHHCWPFRTLLPSDVAMFPSFTGSARRPRQVNLSGRKGNPFAATPSTGQSPSTQTAQSTVAHAQAERALRQQERRRPPAATAIQKSWRGYRDRRKIEDTWRRDWDVWEEADPSLRRAVPTANTLVPYQSQADGLKQLQLLVHFASPREPSDIGRLGHFAHRYQGSVLGWLTACPSNEWIFPLLRLGKLSIAMLQRAQPPITPDDTKELLRLLYTIAGTIPEQMAMYSELFFEALGDLLEKYRDGPASQTGHPLSPNMAILALLRPTTARTGIVYESFVRHVLCRPDLPDGTLRIIESEGRMEDLALALNNLLSRSSSENLLRTKSAEELLWLIAYFIHLHRSTASRSSRSAEGRDAPYVTVLSRLVSHLAVDISSRIDPPSTAISDHSDDSTSLATSPHRPLPPFVRWEILTLISQDHVSGLLAQATASAAQAGDTFAMGSSHTSHLAVYVLTLLRAFPRRGDEIRMWLYLGSTSRQSEEIYPSVPAIKYYYNAATQTSVYKLISDEPSHAISLLNPQSRRRTNTLTVPDRNEQWQIILLFFELYPIVLKVMDDEEFLTGAASSDSCESWTRRSALSLDQVKDLTVFLKNLSFCMYWNASEIAGVDEPEKKNSIAEYFGGNLSAFHDNHPDARSTRPQDAVIAGIRGMTMSYMKGMVTGLLRMIYER
ncbi:MAG: hypothetical protein Q9197_003551, partial [Variospora fuerteventurae]